MKTPQAWRPDPFPETICFQLSLEQLFSKVNSHKLFRGRLVKIMSKKINMTNEQSLERALTFKKRRKLVSQGSSAKQAKCISTNEIFLKRLEEPSPGSHT